MARLLSSSSVSLSSLLSSHFPSTSQGHYITLSFSLLLLFLIACSLETAETQEVNHSVPFPFFLFPFSFLVLTLFHPFPIHSLDLLQILLFFTFLLFLLLSLPSFPRIPLLHQLWNCQCQFISSGLHVIYASHLLAPLLFFLRQKLFRFAALLLMYSLCFSDSSSSRTICPDFLSLFLALRLLPRFSAPSFLLFLLLPVLRTLAQLTKHSLNIVLFNSFSFFPSF